MFNSYAISHVEDENTVDLIDEETMGGRIMLDNSKDACEPMQEFREDRLKRLQETLVSKKKYLEDLLYVRKKLLKSWDESALVTMVEDKERLLIPIQVEAGKEMLDIYLIEEEIAELGGSLVSMPLV